MVMEEMVGVGGATVYFTSNYDPRLVRTWSYQAISHGADAINYYRFRQNPYGWEQLSNFIVNWDSYPGESYKVVRQMGQELPRITDLLHGSTMTSSVAVLVSPDSIWSFSGQPHVEKFQYYRNLLRYYRALRRVQVNVDAAFPQSDFSKYKMIVAPTLLIVEKSLAGKLEEFVRHGGTLILTYLSGYKDGNNWDTQTTLPGFLKDMAGIVIHDFDPHVAQKQEIVMKPDGASYGVQTWFDIIDPTSADTLAVYKDQFYAGKAAFTRNKYGTGTVYYVGTEPTSEEFYQKLMDAALPQAGIPPGPPVPDGTAVAVREKPGKKIVFVLNFTDQPKVISLGQEYQNALTRETEHASVPLSAYDVKILTNQ
jgi:beta-galactosidase